MLAPRNRSPKKICSFQGHAFVFQNETRIMEFYLDITKDHFTGVFKNINTPKLANKSWDTLGNFLKVLQNLSNGSNDGELDYWQAKIDSREGLVNDRTLLFDFANMFNTRLKNVVSA